jgi:sialate O-acetylesterase
MLQRFAGVFVALLFVGNSAWTQEQAPLLAAIFSDHGVLQRDRPIEVWGRAQPGEHVTVVLDNETRKAQADGAGAWAVTLPAMRAGGTHTLTAHTATRSQSVRDLVIGDVWLCSGQSNMEFKVRSALNASWEAAHSADNGIRHVAIPRFAALAPLADYASPLEWKVAAPDTTPNFSAVCYFFARELERTASVDVPQGLIHASWGGSRIETWLSQNALRQLGTDDAKLALLGRFAADRAAGSAEWGRELQKWWSAEPANRGVEPWSTGKATGTWTPAPAKLVPWEDWGVPELAEYDGAMWYRAHVKLTAAQAKQAAKISLGVIDDVDEVWINAQPFATGFGETERSYDVPAKLLKAGENIVVVNVFDMWGSGGMHGDAGQFALRFADGSSVPLGAWEYQPPPKGIVAAPRAPWEPVAGVTVLYNGMIAPLGKYGLRGVAWYQGESNAGLGDALSYQGQLQMLFTDWRQQFDNPLPFFVVQLANHKELVITPVNSGWARLREAQRRAVAEDRNAGLAVTIDIGNRDDIHPTNKLDVGKRLARAARHVVFGEQISPSGAAPKVATRAVGGVDVTLGDFDGKLVVIGAKDPAGFELCGDTQASCHFVRAQLGEGGAVKLEDAAPEKATRVRFCWADAPLCNLYDTTGLPAGPFEISVQ